MAGSTALPRATPLLAEQRALLGGIAANTPAIRAEAEICDAQGSFPRQAMALLEAEGLLRATLPAALGGMDFGIGATGAEALCRLLYRLGDASLAIARLFEAHVNALQLILRYGEPAQAESGGGRGPGWAPVRALGDRSSRRRRGSGGGWRRPSVLRGGKAFCSGAGVATRAIITAATPAGPRLLLVEGRGAAAGRPQRHPTRWNAGRDHRQRRFHRHGSSAGGDHRSGGRLFARAAVFRRRLARLGGGARGATQPARHPSRRAAPPRPGAGPTPARPVRAIGHCP